MSTLDAINGIVNACQAAPNIVTGGQPKEHHIRRLKVAKGAVVLDLRDPMEARDFDEPAAVRAEGMESLRQRQPRRRRAHPLLHARPRDGRGGRDRAGDARRAPQPRVDGLGAGVCAEEIGEVSGER
jgi:hypothetical protein